MGVLGVADLGVLLADVGVLADAEDRPRDWAEAAASPGVMARSACCKAFDLSLLPAAEEALEDLTVDLALLLSELSPDLSVLCEDCILAKSESVSAQVYL